MIQLAGIVIDSKQRTSSVRISGATGAPVRGGSRENDMIDANCGRPIALAFMLLACVGSVPARAQDARAACAKIVDDDRLRPLPGNLVAQARRLFDLSADMPVDFVRTSTSMRCMHGDVWLCNAGANLVCGKADARRRSPGADAFCRQNPNATGVPMAATGHATIYAWTCVGGRARIERRFETIDGRGFIAGNWKRLER
jgi:hypothetical protein